MAEHAEDIKKHVRIYMMIFGALGVLTIVTVAVSYLHVSTTLAVTIALFIASIKASLVACYFMHLISEKKLVYNILILTAAFFVAMMGLILWSMDDQQGTDYQPPPLAAADHDDDHH